MRRISSLIGGGILAVGLFVSSGCAHGDAMQPVVLGSPSMLFGKGYATQWATEIDRGPWPATPGRLESIEETHFVEFFRDYQGSFEQERTNPRRWFRSYRVGSQAR